MNIISVNKISESIERICGQIACVYDPTILQAIENGYRNERSDRSKTAMKTLLDNARIAEKENIPICQDTGLAIVYLRIGQEVCLVDGNLREAVNKGVAAGYTKNCLRASSVNDPLYDRKNTGDNTPAVLYTEIVDGDFVEVEVMAKGFGSENKSVLKMLTPADGEQGVIDFVLDTVKKAGPNACPPFIIGVGIGGTFDSCAVMSKKALMRPISEGNADERYRDLEDRLLTMVNQLKIGPMGFHGVTTALKVQIEYAPTHIAGLPVAVNMCCHVCRHGSEVIR